MSFENKIFDDAPREQNGNKVQAAGETGQSGSLSIRGGQVVTKRPDHVHVENQEIAHLQEKTTSSWSHIYRSNDGSIDPARGSRWTIRANQALTITLGKPPAVPEDQKHPTVTRHREWDVELIIFHATDLDVTWPNNVLWPASVDDSSGDPVFVAGTPPENPRPATKADRFVLRYNERTGEWWALNTHANVAMTDPISPDEDATLPPVVVPDNTSDALEDDTPDVDPQTEGEGVAYALHTDGWSITEDGGFTWLYADLPYESQAFSVDENANFVIAKTDGRVVYLDANGADRTLDFSEEQVLEFPLTNGDFETGNTSGWVVATGDSVSVLKTKTPSQRPGSKYYLTRDANVSDADSEFQISQLFTVPASAAGRDIEVSADVYARTGALGRLRVTSIEGAIDRFTPEESEVDFRAQFRRVTGFTGGYSAIDQRSDAPSELEFTGDVAKLGAITTFRFELRVVDDPTLKERVQIVIDDALGNGSWTASANFDAPFNGISNSNLFNFNSSNGKRGRLKVGNLPIFNRVHP